MTLKITRIAPGRYQTIANGVRFSIVDVGVRWTVTCAATEYPGVVAQGATKKEVVSRLEILLRSTKDRTKSSTHKIPRRKELTPGVELTMIPKSVPGLRGRVRFLGYTKTRSGAEWLDVLDSSGKSRAVDPAKVQTVHRDRKLEGRI